MSYRPDQYKGGVRYRVLVINLTEITIFVR